jgi:hypothetical protein
MTQLMEANVSEEEIAELYEDLHYIFENPFDKKICEAMERNCSYFEIGNQLPN